MTLIEEKSGFSIGSNWYICFEIDAVHLLNILSPLFINIICFLPATHVKSEAYEKWSSSLLSIIFYLPLMRLSSWCAVYISPSPHMHVHIIRAPRLYICILSVRGRCESKICPSFSRRRASRRLGEFLREDTHILNCEYCIFYAAYASVPASQPPGPVLVRAILR
jgi:hypothetical protein